MGKQLVKITDWSITPGGRPYDAPEVRGICAMGKLANGLKILTSRIVAAHGCVVTTESGSKYRLSGPPSVSYADWMRGQKITYDPKRPVNIKKEGAK